MRNISLTFTRREFCEALLQFRDFRKLPARCTVPVERHLNRVEQSLIPEGLGQKLYGACLHRLHSHRDVTIAGQEDDGYADISSS